MVPQDQKNKRESVLSINDRMSQPPIKSLRKVTCRLLFASGVTGSTVWRGCGGSGKPGSCSQKVAGSIPLVCMSKHPWAWYGTPNCSWCAGLHLAWHPPSSVYVCMNYFKLIWTKASAKCRKLIKGIFTWLKCGSSIWNEPNTSTRQSPRLAYKNSLAWQ